MKFGAVMHLGRMDPSAKKVSEFSKSKVAVAAILKKSKNHISEIV